MDGLIGMALGFFLGSMFGFFVTVLIIAARDGDQLMEYLDRGASDGEDDER